MVKGRSWETEVERRQHNPPVRFPCFEKPAGVQRTAETFFFIVVVDAAQDRTGLVFDVYSRDVCGETVSNQNPITKKLDSLITTNNGPEFVSPLKSSGFDQCGHSDVMTYLKEGTEEPAWSRLRPGVSTGPHSWPGVSTAGDQL